MSDKAKNLVRAWQQLRKNRGIIVLPESGWEDWQAVDEAIALAVECTAPAPQPADGFSDSDWKWWFELTAEGRLNMIRRFRAATPQVTPTKLDDPETWRGIGDIASGGESPEQEQNKGGEGFDAPPLRNEPLVTTPQELELEKESNGRWIAEFTRFPGVAAYGKSKEEAIRNAAKVLIESEQALPYEKAWPIIRRALGLPEDHPDGSDILPRIEELKAASEQASPTPDKCPTCGSYDKNGYDASSNDRTKRCHVKSMGRSDPWHSSTATQKGSK